MSKSPIDEVPQVGSTTETPTSFMEAFLAFSADSKERVTAAGDAYANKRAQLNRDAPRDNAKVANKVVVGAEFFPAHPSRFEVRGPGRGPKFKYFVVHRPGSIRWKATDPNTGRRRFSSYEAAVAYAAKACNKRNILQEFKQLNRPASTHFVIGFDGSLVQMVDLDDVSFHTLNRRHPKTGAKLSNYNSFGVELEGYVEDPENPKGASPLTEAQENTLARLLKILSDCPDFQYNVSDPDLVLMHYEIDPSRKTDPGINVRGRMSSILAKARGAGTFTGFYQASVSLDVTERLAAQKFGALVGANQSGQFREIMSGAAASMAASSRAGTLSRTGRNDFYRAAREVALKRVAVTGEQMAVRSKQEQTHRAAQSVVQENRTGLAKNFDTGAWND